MGACTGIVGLFKHLLRVIAHPQFLVLELQVPLGTCSGYYGNYTFGKLKGWELNPDPLFIEHFALAGDEDPFVMKSRRVRGK